MVTIAQRIEELRTAKGLSRPALSSALGMPRMAVEKFETGRQTPSHDQQMQIAAYFQVSLDYLQGRSDMMDDWMDGAFLDEPAAPVQTPRRPAPRIVESSGGKKEKGGAVFDAFLNSDKFQEVLKTAVLDALKTPEGQKLLERAIRRQK